MNSNYYQSTYPSAILDVFERKLDSSSKELGYLDSNYYRLCQEKKYVDFITKIFIANNCKCHIHINMEVNNSETFLYRLNNLDTIDKHILLNQQKHLADNGLTTYVIDDLNLLIMFLKGILREIFRADISFMIVPIIIFSNYDLSIPVITKNKKDMDFYSAIAKESKIFLRSIRIPN